MSCKKWYSYESTCMAKGKGTRVQGGGVKRHYARFRSPRINISQAGLLTQGTTQHNSAHNPFESARSCTCISDTSRSIIHLTPVHSQINIHRSSTPLRRSLYVYPNPKSPTTMSDSNATTPRVFIARHGKSPFHISSYIHHLSQFPSQESSLF